MWQLWQNPFLIIGGLIVIEIIHRYDSKKSIPLKKSVLNVVMPSIIVFLVSYVGDMLFN